MYDREAAVNYARKWSQSRNPIFAIARFPFSIWANEDCANFASQSLFAGGVLFTSAWYNYSPSFNIIGERTDKNFTLSWIQAGSLANWLRNDSGILSGESVIRGGKYFASDVKKALQNAQVGDLVGWCHEENGKKVYHFGIITKIEDGIIYYSAHTKDRTDKPLTTEQIDENGSVVIFFIEDDA